MQLIDFPFAYTYLTRLKNYRAVCTVAMYEWTPLAIVLKLIYDVDVGFIALMLAGWLALYECGYVINDQSDSSREMGGDRLQGFRINTRRFWISHALVFTTSLGTIWILYGEKTTAVFASVCAIVFCVFLFHTSQWVRRVRFLRIATFSTLAMYKFAPLILPSVPVFDSQLILMATFLCYGFPRVVVYALRKFGHSDNSVAAERSGPLLGWASTIAFGPLLLAQRWDTSYARAVALIWLCYGITATSFLISRQVRSSILKQAQTLCEP